jgi:hypothetical protein
MPDENVNPDVVPTEEPIIPDVPVVDPVPTEEPTPVEEPVPTEEPAPVEEPAPAEEPTPVEEPVPTEEPTPVEEPVPTEEPAPVEEPTPTPDPSEIEAAENELLSSVRYIIQRFELNDPISPTYYIIGFKLICDMNQRESYIEDCINYADCVDKSDNEICLTAYSGMRHRLLPVVSDLTKKRFLLGSEFIPPV